MTDRLQRQMDEQRRLAVDMGKHLKDFAATYDLEDDKERHHLRQVATAYVDEQTRYEYMKLQATSQSPTPAEGMVGLAHGAAA